MGPENGPSFFLACLLDQVLFALLIGQVVGTTSVVVVVEVVVVVVALLFTP